MHFLFFLGWKNKKEQTSDPNTRVKSLSPPSSSHATLVVLHYHSYSVASSVRYSKWPWPSKLLYQWANICRTSYPINTRLVESLTGCDINMYWFYISSQPCSFILNLLAWEEKKFHVISKQFFLKFLNNFRCESSSHFRVFGDAKFLFPSCICSSHLRFCPFGVSGLQKDRCEILSDPPRLCNVGTEENLRTFLRQVLPLVSCDLHPWAMWLAVRTFILLLFGFWLRNLKALGGRKERRDNGAGPPARQGLEPWLVLCQHPRHPGSFQIPPRLRTASVDHRTHPTGCELD